MNVIVLGGGICGLSVAYHLTKNNISCTLVEKAPHLGGIASCYHIQDYCIEKYYHHIFKSDTFFLTLIRELGLSDLIEWHPGTTSFYCNNSFYPLNTPLDLLLFKPLKTIDRLRLGIKLLDLGDQGNNLDSLDAEQWIRDRWGEDIYRTLFKPLLRIKFGLDLKHASAAFVHGRLKARSSSRRAGREVLGYLRGSLYELTNALSHRIQNKGSNILTGTCVTKLVKQNHIFEVTTTNGTFKADVVVNTLPLPTLDAIAAFSVKGIRDIRYRSVICACLGLRRRYSDFYWTNVTEDKLPFGAVIEHTNLIPSALYSDDHIIYLVSYCDTIDNIYAMNDDEIMDLYISGLRKLRPDFNSSDILWHRIARDEYATPVFSKGYGRVMPQARSSVPGLYLAGSFQVYPHSRNVNNILMSGYMVTQLIMEDAK